jgi:hypothetical protein
MEPIIDFGGLFIYKGGGRERDRDKTAKSEGGGNWKV